MTQANRSIAPVFASVTNPQIADSEPQGTLPVGPTGVVHRGAGPIPRSTRTPEQVESNRAFMAAAGRVEFGRYEATQRAVWIRLRLLRQSGRRANLLRRKRAHCRTGEGVRAHGAPSHSRTHGTRPNLRREPSGRSYACRVESHPPRRGPEQSRPDTVSGQGGQRVRRYKRWRYVQGRGPFKGASASLCKGG